MMHGPGAFRMLRPRELDQETKITKALVKRVMSFARPYRRALVFLLVVILAGTVLEVAIPPFLIERIIDKAIIPGNLSLLAVLCGAFLGASVASALTQIAARWLSSRIGEGLIYDLRVALFDHVQRMPIAFFTRTQTGSLISRLNSDVVGAQRAVTETSVGVIQIVFSLALALSLMFVRSWKLTLIGLALVPIFVLPTRKMGRLLQTLIRKQMESNAAMSSQMTERFQVGGALLVKLFGRPIEERDKFSDNAGKVRDLGIQSALYGRMFFVAFSLVAAVATALTYWVGGTFVINKSDGFTVGSLVAFAQLLGRLYAPITMLSNVRLEVMTAMVSFERVFEVLDFPSSIQDLPDAHALTEPQGDVVFEDVWFKYPAGSEVSIASLEGPKTLEARDKVGEWVLQGVSFHIPKGQMFALVGPSGAGKTTISSLVPRLYDATRGTVRVDGHDVRSLTLESLGRAVGTVTQDAHMFHETIRTNLIYAKPNASEDELVDALKAAQIYELISSLPDGLDTTVGERGYRFSGGEKQRLAIARLLLKDPAIMILDEATAHLDSESEVLIQRALAQALAGRSSLVIAHRLSTVVNADSILVVDGGRIVEQGPHLELISNKGLYSELYRTQFLGGEPRPNGSIESERVAPAES